VSTTSTGSSSHRRPVPTRPEAIAESLAALGVRPDRGLGQSFLADPFVADAEAALVGTSPGEPVLEFGGGLGILTEALVRRGTRPLTVVERDPRLAAHLRRTFGGEVTVVEADARTYAVPGPFRAVAGNLPYSAATPILLRLFEARVPRVVAMVQSEVADRLHAGPGSRSFGRLSLAAALYGTVELYQPVPASSFVPAPRVASRVLLFTARPGPLPVLSVPAFERVVRTLFSSRRKQLGNLLPRLASNPVALAERAGLPPGWARQRPEQLSVEAFYRLADALAGPAAPENP
jgi:16S rRNA (adenine1518-N6/adenine1519-N6)-dimethyltransferase